MGKKITYLLGAGASYQACPIWKEQGEKMIELATKFLTEEKRNFEDKKPNNLTDSEYLLWYIGYFGYKAREFGTIDTYAKKLNIIGEQRELKRLKLAVSVFFILWESSNDEMKKRTINDKSEKIKSIDSRYISLFAAILEKDKDNNPTLKNNIKFVTWNYDLQLERAFKAFCLDHLDWEYVSKNLSFRVNNENDKKDLDICHLNGYNGFYYLNNKEVKNEEHDLLRTESTEINEILKEIEFASKSVDRGQIRIGEHINYAWEIENPLAKRTLEQAKKIFQETDILIIIGYSFPPFNKDIDALLFNELKGRKTEIYYQDINANDDYLKILTNGFDCKIELMKNTTDHFFLPYNF